MTRHYFDLLANYQLDGITVPDGDTSGPLFRGNKSQMLLKEISQKIHNQILNIHGNKQLTEIGKSEKYSAIRKDESVLGQFDRLIEDFVIPLDRIRSQATNEFKIYLSPRTDPESTARRQEIRQGLKDLSPEKRSGLLDKAIEAGDRVTFDAIVDCPEIFGLISPEQAQKKSLEFARKHKPELAKAAEDSQHASEVVASQALKLLRDIASWSDVDPRSFAERAKQLPEYANTDSTRHERMLAKSASKLSSIDFKSKNRNIPNARDLKHARQN